MIDLNLAIPEKRSVMSTVAVWVPRVVVALVFLSFGSQKFQSTGMWVRVFDHIGWGQWFRYLTGAMQVGGALLLLVPRTAVLGAAMLASTMLGAVVVQILVFHSLAAIMPAILLGIVVALGLSAWASQS